MPSSTPDNVKPRSRRAIVAAVAVVLLVSLLPAPAAAARQTYRDPDDSRGNLDVLQVTGTRVLTDYGPGFRTTLTMEDEWLDEELEIEFYYNELGAKFPRGCGDDCSGDYYGWLYYDESAGEIRASGYEPVNCDCAEIEWPVGRADEHSVWFDIPEVSLYDGTYAYEIEFMARSQRQTEPVSLARCILACNDSVGPLRFPVSPRS